MYTHRELEFHRQAQGSRLGKTNKQTKQQPSPQKKGGVGKREGREAGEKPAYEAFINMSSE